MEGCTGPSPGVSSLPGSPEHPGLGLRLPLDGSPSQGRLLATLLRERAPHGRPLPILPMPLWTAPQHHRWSWREAEHLGLGPGRLLGGGDSLFSNEN